jgi:ketosteroid isomerase-like protein
MSNVDVVRAYFAAMDANDSNAATAAWAPDFEHVSPFGRITDRDALRGLVDAFNVAFPGMVHSLDRVIEVDDVVVLEGRWTGTHTGELNLPDGSTLPATGRTADFPWCGIGRVEAGLIASTHVYFDTMSLMAQLGLVPQSDAA